MTPGTILSHAPANLDGTIDPLVRRHRGAGHLDEHDGAPDRSSSARKGRSYSRMGDESEDSFPHLAMLPPPPRLHSSAAALPKSPTLGQSLDSIATPAPLSPLSSSPGLPTERAAIPDIPPLTKASAKGSTPSSHTEGSESLRRPSLPLLLDKARNANPTSSIKAALVRNANFSPHVFRTKPASNGQPQIGAGDGGGVDELPADNGSSSEVLSSSSATSRRLAAKKSVSSLLRKAASGLSTGAAKIDSRRRSSSSISSASIGSTDANGAPQVPMGRASFSHHSNPPVSAFAVRKGSSPTPSVFSRRKTYYEDDAALCGSRRRANSSASLSGSLLRRRSQKEKAKVAGPTGEAQSDHEVALRSVPPSPLRRDPSSSKDLPSRNSTSETSPLTMRTSQVPVAPPSPTQGSDAKAKLAALTLGQDRPLTRDRRSHSTPHVTRAEPHFSSQPMSARGATMDSLSVEAHQDLLLKYADQFAEQGAAPVGSGGETVTLAQQLIAVGEALAAERLQRSRSGTGGGGGGANMKDGETPAGAASSSALPSVQEHHLQYPPSPMDKRV